MEELVTVLQAFQVATTFLQYEHNTSLSCYNLWAELNVQPLPDDSSAIRKFKTKRLVQKSEFGGS